MERLRIIMVVKGSRYVELILVEVIESLRGIIGTVEGIVGGSHRHFVVTI